ncbi:hypothetical protein CLAIMM_15038, partial [Cladophialophora immunda]
VKLLDKQTPFNIDGEGDSILGAKRYFVGCAKVPSLTAVLATLVPGVLGPLLSPLTERKSFGSPLNRRRGFWITPSLPHKSRGAAVIGATSAWAWYPYQGHKGGDSCLSPLFYSQIVCQNVGFGTARVSTRPHPSINRTIIADSPFSEVF